LWIALGLAAAAVDAAAVKPINLNLPPRPAQAPKALAAKLLDGADPEPPPPGGCGRCSAIPTTRRPAAGAAAETAGARRAGLRPRRPRLPRGAIADTASPAIGLRHAPTRLTATGESARLSRHARGAALAAHDRE
jgi:hypothetical protein